MKESNPFIKRYLAVLPKDFDLENLLIDNPIKVEFKKNDPIHIRDRLIYLISVVYYRFKKKYPDHNIWESEEYVNLCYKFLHPVIYNYRVYITYLIEAGIIETDGSWQYSRKCLGFRFTEAFRTTYKEKRIEYVYDKKIYKNLQKVRQPIEVKIKYSELHLHLHHLHYDKTLVDKVLKEVYPNKEDQHKKYMQYDNLMRLKYPDTWTFRTGETGRLYTPITNLKAKLRDCLKYKSQELIEIDIKSSIPAMSLLFFNPDKLEHYKETFNMYASNTWNPDLLNYSKNLIDIENIDSNINYTNSNRGIFYNNTSMEGSSVVLSPSSSSINSHIMSSKKSLLHVIPEDIIEFQEDVKSGDIYIRVKTQWNIKLNKSYSRKTAKKKLLCILNSPSHWDSPEKQILKELYPNTMNIFNSYNGYFKTRSQRSKDTSLEKRTKPPFAYFTQSVESDFVLNKVCGRLGEEYPHVPLFTIHDAIYTTQEFKRLVEDVMKEESLKWLGSEVRLGD